MYIIKADYSVICDLSRAIVLTINVKPDAVLVRAIFERESSGGWTLGTYQNASEAKEVMAQIFMALKTGEECFTMPDSRLHAEERNVRDSRSHRRGGS